MRTDAILNWPILVVAFAALLLIAAAARARPPLIEDRPGALKDARLLGELIEQAGITPVHIVYVHGMRAERPGAASRMREELQRYLKLTPQERKSRTFIDLGPTPLGATYVGVPIWGPEHAEEEWLASRPFVDRYELRSGDRHIILDEINWWPLLFPLKCRFLVVPEHDLSGNDRKHIDRCSSGKSTGRSRSGHEDEPIYYPWISPEERARLLGTRPRSGGGALANARLKQQIMNWGLSDAVIALGPMREYIRRSMNDAFAGVSRGVPDDAPRAIVAESLGSFVVLDSMRSGGKRVRSFVNRTADLYFFANQFALLDLAHINLPSEAPPAPTDQFAPGFPRSQLDSALSQLQPPKLRQSSYSSLTELQADDSEFVPKQVIAFSDPSDLLTWRVPQIAGVKIINVYVPATGDPFGLFASPERAHRGAITSKAVWKLLLSGERPK